MFIFDAPYISEMANTFLAASQCPVLANDFCSRHVAAEANTISEPEAIRIITNNDGRWLYSNSENAISWITEKLGADSRLARNIDLFKNKCTFREATRHLFPELKFLKVSAQDLTGLRFEDIGSPFIIKPVVGFISAGVHRVNDREEWIRVKREILAETEVVASAFPDDVLNSDAFILESIIEGEEYAVDAYFDDHNEPVILNILHHKFRDDHDMSDRLYVTSSEIIRNQLGPINTFLSDIAKIGDFRGMPLHVEVRITAEGNLLPIEINPLRFAGWCSTDIAWYAYSINVYDYFLNKKRPDWQTLLKGRESHIYGMGLIERSQLIEEESFFDYERFKGEFSSVLELREIDYRTFPLYAFVFFKTTTDTPQELDRVLSLDPEQFVMRQAA